MEFNDGNQWHRLTNLDAYLMAGRDMFGYRVSSRVTIDREFDRHRAITTGLRGTVLYHFAYSDTPAEVQANAFVSALDYVLQQHEMICLDVETGGGFGLSNAHPFARTWLSAVEGMLGTRAWIYVPGALSTALSASVTDGRVIWAPRYSGTASRGPEPTWRHDVHQYSDRGFFPGSPDGPGDISHTALTTEALLARTGAMASPCRS